MLVCSWCLQWLGEVKFASGCKGNPAFQLKTFCCEKMRDKGNGSAGQQADYIKHPTYVCLYGIRRPRAGGIFYVPENIEVFSPQEYSPANPVLVPLLIPPLLLWCFELLNFTMFGFCIPSIAFSVISLDTLINFLNSINFRTQYWAAHFHFYFTLNCVNQKLLFHCSAARCVP